MPRITKVTTRTGDDGSTALGTGARVSKAALRIRAYGTVDELNAALGVVLTTAGLAPDLVAPLERIQNDLFHVGADLCMPPAAGAPQSGPRVEERHVLALDQFIRDFNDQLEPLRNFVLPGGSPAAAQLHVARTVCRRAESLVVELAGTETVSSSVVMYLNRLSDALFVLSRFQNKIAGAAEPIWDSRA